MMKRIQKHPLNHTIKIAITLPALNYKEIEKKRKETNQTRSGFILAVIRHWFECLEHQKKINSYIEGYRRSPENKSEEQAYMKAQMNGLSEENWS